MKEIIARRICWPEPDATCLEGGCGYCVDEPFRSVKTIEKWARTAGVVQNRGTGEQDAWEAWQRGLRHDFYNRIPVRRRSI